MSRRRDERDAGEVRPLHGLMPPADMNAEAAVLSAIINKPADIDTVAALLPPAAFYSKANRFIYEAILALHAEGSKVDVVTVRGHLKTAQRLEQVGGGAYLIGIIDATPAIENIEAHAKLVVEHWRKRQVIALCQRYAAEGYGDVGEVQAWIDAVEKAVADVGSTARQNTLELAGVVLGRHLDVLGDFRQRGVAITGTPVGLRDLDRTIAGLHDGDLYIIAARPGAGKTALACNIAMTVAEGDWKREIPPTGVAFFSLEMPREQIAMRFACTRKQVPFRAVRENQLKDDQWDRMVAAAAELSKIPLWIDDTAGISMAALRSKVRKLKRDIEAGKAPAECRRLGLVVVDYLQLMRGERLHGDSREREVSSVSQGLKNLAKELSVPVIALSQLNRSVEKSGKKEKRPGLADLRESGAIEQDADTVIFIYRPGYYDPSANQRECELIIAKQRNGPTCTIEVVIELKYGKFYDAAHAQLDPELEALSAAAADNVDSDDDGLAGF